MLNKINLIKLKEEIIHEINNINEEILINKSIDKYINLLDRYPYVSNYKFVSKQVRGFIRSIENIYNTEILGIYHKLLLINLIINSLSRIETAKFPEEIKELYKKQFSRIVKRIENNIKGNNLYFQIKQDKFLKDIALCRMKMIPAGPQNLDIDRLSRSFIFRNGITQFVNGLLYVTFKLKGFKPFYRMHMNQIDPQAMSEFNTKGWQNLFIRVALLLKINRNIKGLAGSSWIFDPAVKTISPELAYIHNLMKKYHGKVFVQGTDPVTIKNATFMNPKRKMLYKEKKYLPKRYLIIFSRKDILQNSV